MHTFTPSRDQAQALEDVFGNLWPGTVTVLTGPAGSGKTSLLMHIIERIEKDGGNVILGAPTGKAAQRMREVLRRPAKTIHSLLYRHAKSVGGELVFGRKVPPCLPGEFLILDEGSMIGMKLWDDLLQMVPEESAILVVGDREQLTPVLDVWGPELLGPTANLTKVHRQAMGNPIIAYATAIREGTREQWEKGYEWDERLQIANGHEKAIDWYLGLLEADEDVALITYTHQVRRKINSIIRDRLGLSDEPINPGDRLVVKANNPSMGLMNGDVITVREILGEYDYGETPYYELTIYGETLPVKICIPFIEADSEAFWGFKRTRPEGENNWLHVHYGQCITVHSAQGSQWDNVGFLWDWAFERLLERDREEGRRFHYTAVTRAAKNLRVYYVPI